MQRNIQPLMSKLVWLIFIGIAGWPAPQLCSADVYGDTKTKRYHTEECQEKKALKARYRKIFSSEEEAGSRGFYPCTTCIPPAGREFLKQREQVRHSQPVVRNAYYVGDKQNKRYHYQWCAAVKTLPPAEHVKFQDVEAAVKGGYERCPECRPPIPMVKMQPLPEEPDASQATPAPQNAEPAAKPKPTAVQELEDVLPGTSM